MVGTAASVCTGGSVLLETVCSLTVVGFEVTTLSVDVLPIEDLASVVDFKVVAKIFGVVILTTEVDAGSMVALLIVELASVVDGEVVVGGLVVVALTVEEFETLVVTASSSEFSVVVFCVLGKSGASAGG